MKKIALFLVANLLFVNCLLAQIKPLKFGRSEERRVGKEC